MLLPSNTSPSGQSPTAFDYSRQTNVLELSDDFEDKLSLHGSVRLQQSVDLEKSGSLADSDIDALIEALSR